MTQVPGTAQRPSAVPVVPGDASTPDSPAAARTAPATGSISDAVHNRVALAIHRTGVSLEFAGAFADLLLADTELLDVLVAHRQKRVIETDEECDALPVGTIVVDFYEAGCIRVHSDPYIGWVRATSALRSRMGHQQHRPWLPATVLYIPQETDRA